MTDMEWLLQRMLYEIEETNPYSSAYERIICKYAKMAEIQVNVNGDIYNINDFIEHVESGTFTSYDGHGYYYDAFNQRKGDKITFDIDELYTAAGCWQYVIWYNK